MELHSPITEHNRRYRTRCEYPLSDAFLLEINVSIALLVGFNVTARSGVFESLTEVSHRTDADRLFAGGLQDSKLNNRRRSLHWVDALLLPIPVTY